MKERVTMATLLDLYMSRSRTGKRKAADFPEPVTALAQMSFPIRASGIASPWMGVGSANPIILVACKVLAIAGGKQVKKRKPSTKALKGAFLQRISPQFWVTELDGRISGQKSSIC